MSLELILATLTAAAVLAVAWPFVRRAGVARSGSDVMVYRDQLDEVERDLAAGLIGKTAARVEISRRLLAAVDAGQTMPAESDAMSAVWRRRVGVVASLLAVPIVAGGLYLWLGSPELAERNVAPAQQSIMDLVARAEAQLKRNPEDGRGWEILAPVYMRLNRYSDAVTAWKNAIGILGESAEREANLGEALTAEANGIVTSDADNAFERAVTLDETLVSARYYLGLAAEQDGQRDKAAKIWRGLIAEAPADAFWVDEVRTALARVENGSTPPSATAANQQPQQAAMIQGMVDRLAARLKEDGSDVDGWVRLVRAYTVLGESENASAAVTNARQVLAGDPAKLNELNVGLKELNTANAGIPAPSAPGPGTATTAAATVPSDHEHGAAVQDMIERLAERLKLSGSDPQGWLMLVRSYVALGETNKVSTAISDARQALAADPDKLEQFNKALTAFSIGQ